MKVKARFDQIMRLTDRKRQGRQPDRERLFR